MWFLLIIIPRCSPAQPHAFNRRFLSTLILGPRLPLCSLNPCSAFKYLGLDINL
ncbi:hypothetical protein Hanom_Chr02g00121321 [Helianthus anomalus]